MNSFAKYILFLFATLIFGGVLFSPSPVHADIIVPKDLGVGITAKNAELDTEKSIPKIAGKVLGAALSLIGLTFFIITIYAGILWMTAHGNEENTTKAKSMLTAAVIGTFIIFGAYAITKFAFETVETGGGAGGSGGSPGQASLTCTEPTIAYKVIVNDNTGLNIRFTPDTTENISINMPYEADFQVCKNTPKGSWHVVSYNGTVGWANIQQQWAVPK
jgi:hypothetical protein